MGSDLRHISQVAWVVCISRATLFFLLAPKIDRDEPSWWNYMEHSAVTGVLWRGAGLSELFDFLFGLCSVLIHGGSPVLMVVWG